VRAVLGALLLLSVTGCGTSPESLLVGQWEEVAWRTEKLPDRDPSQTKWIDGIRFRDYSDRRIIRHEAEHWQFRPDRTLLITLRSGERVRARWRLKGRGHVLTIRYPDTSELEVYDIKKLTEERLVLHYDMGMEVRGIARLEFRRNAKDQARPLEGNSTGEPPTTKGSRS
jgi:hypothetical protein